MINYIIVGEYLVNIILCSILFTNKYKKQVETHLELEKTKEYLKAYMKKENIIKPEYRILDEKEKQILAEVLLKLKKENKELYDFSKVVILYANKTSIRNLGNNFQTIKINKNKKNKLIMILKNDSTIGKYNPKTNEINTYNDKKTTLNHELLHASSSNPFFSSIGFNRIFKENKEINLRHNEIGRGLNEGYTELLNNRLFKEISFSYIHLNKIAYLIELLFTNKNEMKDYYFNNDIEGIIYELNKYINKEEIINLLIDIDELYYNKSILLYYKIKKRIFKIYEQNKTKEEIKNFKKEYHKNHLVKIMKKTL